MSLHQLVGSAWALGTSYRLSQAKWETDFTEVSDPVATNWGFPARTSITGTLQSWETYALYQTAGGFFARCNAIWLHQTNEGYSPARPTSDSWHLDLLAGYRFGRRQAELTAGILNLTDEDYRLSPVNLHVEGYRTRTFFTQLKFHF